MAEYRQSEIDRVVARLKPELERMNYRQVGDTARYINTSINFKFPDIDIVETAKKHLAEEYAQQAAAAAGRGRAAQSAQQAAEAVGHEQERAQASAQYLASEVAGRVAQIVEAQKQGGDAILSASSQVPGLPVAGRGALALVVLVMAGFLVYKVAKK